MIKFKSYLFLSSKRGTPGRKATRNLDGNAVNRALNRGQHIGHQLKFLPRQAREHAAALLAS